jgi:hypothetical protein
MTLKKDNYTKIHGTTRRGSSPRAIGPCHLHFKTTIEIDLSADNCSHLHLSFFGFEQIICYVLNGHSIKSWPLNSTGALFASNDSKTSFELRKKWPSR